MGNCCEAHTQIQEIADLSHVTGELLQSSHSNSRDWLQVHVVQASGIWR